MLAGSKGRQQCTSFTFSEVGRHWEQELESTESEEALHRQMDNGGVLLCECTRLLPSPVITACLYTAWADQEVKVFARPDTSTAITAWVDMSTVISDTGGHQREDMYTDG